MFYEEKLIFGILYTRTSPKGKWSIKIPHEVEKDLTKRWESGAEHHPQSVALYNVLEQLDWDIGGDALSLSSGGDGDNGEHIMYLLDIYFETIQHNKENNVGH